MLMKLTLGVRFITINRATIFDLLYPSPFSDKKYAEKTQTEKKCERANTENRLPSNPFSLLLRIIFN